MTLTLDLPDSIVELLHLKDQKAAERHVLELVTLEAYKNGEISRGKVAKILDMGFDESMHFLAKHNAHRETAPEEYLENMRQVEKLFENER